MSFCLLVFKNMMQYLQRICRWNGIKAIARWNYQLCLRVEESYTGKWLPNTWQVENIKEHVTWNSVSIMVMLIATGILITFAAFGTIATLLAASVTVYIKGKVTWRFVIPIYMLHHLLLCQTFDLPLLLSVTNGSPAPIVPSHSSWCKMELCGHCRQPSKGHTAYQ